MGVANRHIDAHRTYQASVTQDTGLEISWAMWCIVLRRAVRGGLGLGL